MKAELQTEKPWYVFWRKSKETSKGDSGDGLVEAKRETLAPSASRALVLVEKPAEKKGWSSAESTGGSEAKVSLASVEPAGFFSSAPVRKSETLSASVRPVERRESSLRSEYDWEWESPSSSRREPPKPSKSATQLKIEREKLTIPDSFPDSLSVENYDAVARLAKYAQRSEPSLAFADTLSNAL
ncbi:MAG TPA: hypothetical protein VH208_06325, partial [Myxococcaceae bacterium]|nr:hypothetical protein [Myxococcaceae bacterium]